MSARLTDGPCSDCLNPAACLAVGLCARRIAAGFTPADRAAAARALPAFEAGAARARDAADAALVAVAARWTERARRVIRRIVAGLYDDGVADSDVDDGNRLLRVAASHRLSETTDGRSLLKRLVDEASSDDGVTGDTVRTAERWLVDHDIANGSGQ